MFAISRPAPTATGAAAGEQQRAVASADGDQLPEDAQEQRQQPRRGVRFVNILPSGPLAPAQPEAEATLQRRRVASLVAAADAEGALPAPTQAPPPGRRHSASVLTTMPAGAAAVGQWAPMATAASAAPGLAGVRLEQQREELQQAAAPRPSSAPTIDEVLASLGFPPGRE